MVGARPGAVYGAVVSHRQFRHGLHSLAHAQNIPHAYYRSYSARSHTRRKASAYERIRNHAVGDPHRGRANLWYNTGWLPGLGPPTGSGCYQLAYERTNPFVCLFVRIALLLHGAAPNQTVGSTRERIDDYKCGLDRIVRLLISAGQTLHQPQLAPANYCQ